ncbi:MAG: hypothetical protein AB7N91_01825 [Candidatus Tectimicrobiota bacterium]
MPPPPSLGSWWSTHLQLPGYDPIATAGLCRFDMRAAEQALTFCTQLLDRSLSAWEAAIILNLWGWRRADGRRRYVTVYAEPYRQDALIMWCAVLALWLLRAAPPRRPPHVTLSYAQAPLAAQIYAQVATSLTRQPALLGTLSLEPAQQSVETSRGGRLSFDWLAELYTGEILLRREEEQPLTLAVSTRDAERSPLVEPLAEAAQQALAGQPGVILPAVV